MHKGFRLPTFLASLTPHSTLSQTLVIYSLGMACACLPFAHTLLLPGMLFSVPTVLSVPLGFTYVLLGGGDFGMGDGKLQSYLTRNNAAQAPKGAGGKGAFSPADQAF